jgi:hypothetical protein
MQDREKEIKSIVEEVKKELVEIRKDITWREACMAIYNNMDNPKDKVIVCPVEETGERYQGFEGIGVLYCKHEIYKNDTKYKVMYEHK